MKKIFYTLSFFLISALLFSCSGNKKGPVSNNISDTLSPEITKLNAKIKADPENADLYNERAKLLVENGNVEEALTDIRTAMNFDSTKTEYFLTLSDIYFAQGKVKNCKQAIQKSLKLDPDYAEADLKYAELSLYFKEYDTTMFYINKALAVDKINAKAYFMKGMTYKEKGDTAKAVSNFQTAVDQDGDYYHAYIQLGLIFSARHNKLAEDYFNNAIKLNPKSTEARYGLAMYFQENGKSGDAITQYDSIIKINPKYKNAFYNLGYINLVELSRYDEAIRYFTKAIAIDGKYAEAYYNRGYCYELKKDYVSAKADYSKALELRSNYDKAIDGLNRLEK